MGAHEIIAHLSALGFRLAREGEGIRITPRSALTDEVRALIRENKAELLAAFDTAAETRRQRALARLAADPVRLAVICDGKGDPVPVTVAIRGEPIFEVCIPATEFAELQFDPERLIQRVTCTGDVTVTA